jgi:hypothetical protein
MVTAALALAGLLGWAEQAPDLLAPVSSFRGVVLYPDGETPVGKLHVRVWNADTDEVVYTARTGPDGVFEIPKLAEGNHYVTVGSVRIDMQLLKPRAGVTPQPHGIVVVVPKRLPIMQFLIPGAGAAALAPQVMSP